MPPPTAVGAPRSPPPVRSFPGRLRGGSLLLLFALSLLLAVPSVSARPLPAPSVAAPVATAPALLHSSSPGSSAQSVGAVAFDAAAASLARGAGPADGVPLGCSVGPGGLSGTCGSPLAATGASPVGVFGSGVPVAAPRPNNPGPLYGATMAFDPSGSIDAVILFGGVRTTGYVSGETWSFASGVWYNFTGLIRAPPGRWGAAMAFDAADGYLLLMGGCGVAPIGGFCPFALPDSWSLSANGWAPVDPASWGPFGNGPGTIYDAAMTFDTRDSEVVLVGGAMGFNNMQPTMGPPPPPPPVPTITVESGVFVYASGSWSPLGTLTPARYGAQMAYDPAAGEVILFGGTNRNETTNGTVFADTWGFAGGAWTTVHSGASPEGRWGGILQYDPVQRTLLLIGGAVVEGTTTNDIWGFAGLSNGWSVVRGSSPPVSTVPDARYLSVATFDAFDNYLVLTGGQSASGSAFSDTWTEVAGRWDQVVSNAPFPANPGTRWQPGLAYLPTGGLVGQGVGLLFGGEHCTNTHCIALGDTWKFTSGLWVPLRPSVAPAPRFGAAMASFPPYNEVILFGGCGAVCPMGDTWSFANGRWTQLQERIAPAPRYFASLSYDATSGFLVLFGGCEGGHRSCPDGDTWIFSQGHWDNATGSLGTPSPPARFGAGYDSGSGEALIYGGMGTSGALNDTWLFTFPLFSSPQWDPLPSGSAVAVPAVVFPTLGYDPVHELIMLWSGCGAPTCPQAVPFEYWFNGTIGAIPPGPPGPGQLQFGWNLWIPPHPYLPPPPTYGTAAMWYPAGGPTGYVLLVGGRSVNGQSSTVCEEFVGAAFVDLTPWT